MNWAHICFISSVQWTAPITKCKTNMLWWSKLIDITATINKLDKTNTGKLTWVTSGSSVFSTDFVRMSRFFGSHLICREPDAGLDILLILQHIPQSNSWSTSVIRKAARLNEVKNDASVVLYLRPRMILIFDILHPSCYNTMDIYHNTSIRFG